MTKYVIELRPDCKVVQQICESNGQFCVGARSIQYLEELNSDYINEHYGDLQDDAYQRGLEDGKQTAIGAAELREKLEYQKGFKDGKAIHEKGCEGCKFEGTEIYHRPCCACRNVYPNQWTAKDDKIEVGDEVEVLNSGSKYLIAWIAGTSICGFAYDGVTCHLQPSDVRKTGRHFDIESILEEMRND